MNKTPETEEKREDTEARYFSTSDGYTFDYDYPSNYQLYYDRN